MSRREQVALLVMGLLSLALLGAACTIDVGQPNIDIQCVEVTLPNEHVLYCDDGGVTPIPTKPSDSGVDHGG